jgi:hypothetical protein
VPTVATIRPARFDRGAGRAMPHIVTARVSGKEFMQEGGLRSLPLQSLQL